MIENLNKYKPIYEFLVWDNCNNNCKFCFQREKPRLYTHTQRIFILDEVIKFIESDKFIKGSHILICGGEIFDKPNDFLQLNIFFDKIISFMKNNVVELLYINTNLIYKNLEGVNYLLSIIKLNDLFDRLRFTTSYDIVGRFKNEEDRKLMLNNLKLIKENFIDCKIVTNIILTKQLCYEILNKKFSVKNFMNTYKCWVNLIPYIVYDKNLSGTRGEIFKTLKEVDKENPGYLEYYIPNMSITQEKWLYMYKNNKFEFCSCKIEECGHSTNFKRYSEKNTCFCCDLKSLFGK